MSGRDVEVLSTERDGRLARQLRLEMGGHVQSWVLAGPEGAAELRGTAPYWLYCVTHRPDDTMTHTHSLLVLVDANVWTGPRCSVLEGPCAIRLLEDPSTLTPAGLDLACPWDFLRRVYRENLEGGRA